MDRRNASTLLDGVLESGRADEIALITEEGTVSYGELARMVAEESLRGMTSNPSSSQSAAVLLASSSSQTSGTTQTTRQMVLAVYFGSGLQADGDRSRTHGRDEEVRWIIGSGVYHLSR